ncbi:MAG: PAS domain-containing protein [Leptospiraceae bacterium]|nr:PAS domain-containing protein [Leptospiraceae bacterium]
MISDSDSAAGSQLSPLQGIQDILDDHFLVSKTDAKGRITFANDIFCQISKYTPAELIGQPHNIVRHPDMPREVFRDVWDSLKAGRSWQGLIKNRAKDGSIYWVQALIYPNPDVDSPDKYISVRVDVTQAMHDHAEVESNEALHWIMKLGTASMSLEAFLRQCLDIIMALPWLSLVDRGGFMLDRGEGVLRISSTRNCGESLLETCATVAYGHCLCGQAAEKREILFKDHVDDDHHNHPAGMQPHGHYNVPLIYENRLIGVLFLYVEHGHKRQRRESVFLERLGQLLATIIIQKQAEEELSNAMIQLRQSNVDIQMQLSRIEILQEMVKQYTPRRVWEAAPNALRNRVRELPSEKVKLGFLFCDMQGFTHYSENHSPSEIIDTLNEFFDEAVHYVQDCNGDVERFMGDAFFAVFENTHDGARAAVKVLQAFREVNHKRKAAGRQSISFRMGYHAGEVIRGNVGGRTRKEYSVMGDAVNIAARLESACEPDRILISKEVADELQDQIRTGQPFAIDVKGKDLSIDVCYLKAVRSKAVG